VERLVTTLHLFPAAMVPAERERRLALPSSSLTILRSDLDAAGGAEDVGDPLVASAGSVIEGVEHRVVVPRVFADEVVLGRGAAGVRGAEVQGDPGAFAVALIQAAAGSRPASRSKG
jgi:hypothetical protein